MASITMACEHIAALEDEHFEQQRIASWDDQQRRQEERRRLKRAANRKSACTSRARKKAYVEEMTCANAQLRWRAQILELLPDITIAVRPASDGAKPGADALISYMSAAAHRELGYDIDQLLELPIEQLIAPQCRGALRAMLERTIRACEGSETGSSDGTSIGSSGGAPPETTDDSADDEAASRAAHVEAESDGKEVATGPRVSRRNLERLSHQLAAELGPTELCVIRKNCSTIWCEATASLSFELAEPAFASDSTDEASQDDHEATESGSPQPSLLLCLRRRGDGPPVAEELRPVPPPRRQERERPLAAQGPAQVRLHAPTTAHAEPTAARTPAASLPLDSAVAREPPAASGAARSAQAAKPWLTADARRVQPVLTTRGASPAKPAHLPTPALGGGGSGRVSTDVQHAVESLMSIGGLRMP